MRNIEILDKAIEELGLGSVMYILSWGVIGLGVGCLIGYTTRASIINNFEKENA